MYTEKAKFAFLHASLDFARDELIMWHSESRSRKREGRVIHKRESAAVRIAAFLPCEYLTSRTPHALDFTRFIPCMKRGD